ncbi:MAG: phosphodiester glycosidase family protein [Clostridia bacterium]|nr:phosphodiester glycosidase family protein [Clostridia bacterium]
MKLTKKTVAVLLSVLMILSVAATVAAAAGTYALTPSDGQHNINDDVTYQKFSLTSGERVIVQYKDGSGKDQEKSILISEMATYQKNYPSATFKDIAVGAAAIEFDTNDGYIPMAFMGYAGTSATVEKQYQIATNKYGYEVVGAINGSFFSMDQGGNGQYGTLVDYIISNGKVMSAHAGDACEVVAFASDGTFQTVQSMIDYAMYINGQSVGSLYYINKTSGTKNANNWGNGFYYFDTSCGSITDTNDDVMGYNVLCRKLDHTDLVVGGTLKGEVISVTEGTDGAQVSEGYDDVSDKFDIFVKSTSPNAKFVKDLQPGDSINIVVSETVEESREIIENANSVIENVGWLVKNGVDLTRTQSTIGTHSVTLMARWTAFGRKADGSYVFFTSDSMTLDGSSYSTGNSYCVTLRDVAKAMIEMGCVDVIRMDGGGSVAMYGGANVNGSDPGYLMVTTGYVRPVADCILIVRMTSAAVENVTQALRDAAAEAKQSENIEAAVQEVLDEIDALLESDPHPMLSDARRLLMKLAAAASGKDELNAQIANAAGISYSDYSFEALEGIRAAYDEALVVFGDPEATGEQVSHATEQLRYWLSLTGSQDLPLSLGASYTIDQGDTYSNSAYVSLITDDGVRLTDGSKGSTELMSNAYSAFEHGSSKSPIITVDLGSVKSANTFKAYTGGGGGWGISSPASILMEVSENGKTFTEAGTMTYADHAEVYTDGETWDSEVMTLRLEENVKVRYARFTLKTVGNFAWIEELEVCTAVEPIDDAVYITGFNRMVYTSDSCLFNHEVGNILENNGAINAKWTQNVFLKWDPNYNCWRVTKNTFAGGNPPNVTLAEDELLLAVHGDSGTDGFPNRQYAALHFKVGTAIGLYGVDVENAKLTIASFARVIQPEDLKPVLQRGDIDGDGKVNAKYYNLLKRMILGSLTPTEEQLPRLDINQDGRQNAGDYNMLKRVVLGTYSFS